MKNKDKLEALVMEVCRSHKERTLMFAVLGELQTLHQRVTALEQSREGSKPSAPKVTKKAAAKKESDE